jgi:hypothetical protein
MNKDNTATSAKTGALYSYTWEHKTGAAYGEFMNRATRYQRVYFQINLTGPDGESAGFTFVDDINDTASVNAAVARLIAHNETPAGVLESMHSRFD